MTTGSNVEYIKLDSAIPSGSISGSFYKQFKPFGLGLKNKPSFTNRGNTIRQNRGLIIRQDGKVGVGTSQPQAIFHISASDTGSNGKVNNILFKIEKPDGTEFKITDSEIKYQDKKGNISRRKFNSIGQEILVSGSSDTSTSELNQIIFDLIVMQF